MQNNTDLFYPQIIWEKWIDPFGHDLDESKWNDYDDSDDSEYLQAEMVKNLPKPVKVISSPMGLIPYNEHTASSKIFNFWIGHTNFNLSKPVIDLIEKIDGIEILDIFTRYRFRIGIGKCFKDNEVMDDIKQNIYTFFNIPIYHNDN